MKEEISSSTRQTTSVFEKKLSPRDRSRPGRVDEEMLFGELGDETVELKTTKRCRRVRGTDPGRQRHVQFRSWCSHCVASKAWVRCIGKTLDK